MICVNCKKRESILNKKWCENCRIKWAEYKRISRARKGKSETCQACTQKVKPGRLHCALCLVKKGKEAQIRRDQKRIIRLSVRYSMISTQLLEAAEILSKEVEDTYKLTIGKK